MESSFEVLREVHLGLTQNGVDKVDLIKSRIEWVETDIDAINAALIMATKLFYLQDEGYVRISE